MSQHRRKILGSPVLKLFHSQISRSKHAGSSLPAVQDISENKQTDKENYCLCHPLTHALYTGIKSHFLFIFRMSS